jgi:hypothetical protein
MCVCVDRLPYFILHSYSDTSLPLLDLLQCPGSVNMARLQTSCSELLLPLLIGGLCADASARITTATGLLHRLEQTQRALFQWEQCSSASTAFVPLPPYESITLENALVENRNVVHISSSMTVDITAVANACAGLAHDIAPASCPSSFALRRVLRDSVRCGAAAPIPAWQHISNSREWLQCPPWQCAQLESLASGADVRLFRKLTLRPGSLCPAQVPHLFKADP